MLLSLAALHGGQGFREPQKFADPPKSAQRVDGEGPVREHGNRGSNKWEGQGERPQPGTTR